MNSIWNKLKEKWSIVILVIIVLMQVANVIYTFEVKKQSYHSDELFSYGYANSYYMPLLSANELAPKTEDELINRNQWLSGKLFRNYFVVEKEHRFAYDSVYYNNTKDVHPVLYSLILHTISSFFPGVYSEWFGLSINLFCLIVTAFMIYGTVTILTGQKFLGLITCAVYGFSLGGVDTYIFIRMYALSTCLGMVLTYFLVRLYKEWKNSTLIACMITTMLGAATHYYFWVYAFCLALMFCFYYIIKKQYKKMFVFGVAELCGIIGSVIINRNLLVHLSSIGDAAPNKGISFEMVWAKLYLVHELTGLAIPARPSYFWINLAEVTFILAIVVLPIAFVVRKELWFKKLIVVVKQLMLDTWHFLVKYVSPVTVGMLLAIILEMFLVCRSAAIFVMGNSSIRYFFNIFPAIYILLVLVVYLLIRLLFWGITKVMCKNLSELSGYYYIINAILVVVMLAMLTFNHLAAHSSFWFDDDNSMGDLYIEDIPQECNYIIALKQAWVLNCLAYYMQDVENVFVSSYGEMRLLPEVKEKLKQIDLDKKTYIMVEKPDWNELVEDSEKEYEFDEAQKIMDDTRNVNDEKVQKYIANLIAPLKDEGLCKQYTYCGTTVCYGYIFYIFELN